MPSSVVGTCTTGTPRWYAAAANPATSVTSPPPTATTTSARVSPQDAHARHSASTVASVLAASPSAISKRAVLPARDRRQLDVGLGDDGRPGGAGRQDAGQLAADAGTDEHRVGAAAEGDLDGDHAVTWASWATTRLGDALRQRLLRLLLAGVERLDADGDVGDLRVERGALGVEPGRARPGPARRR